MKYPIGFHFFTNLENVFGPPLNTGWTVAEYTERGEYLCDSDSGKTKNDMWLESEIDWYVNGGWKEQLPKS